MPGQTGTRSTRYPVQVDLTDLGSVYTQLFELIPDGASVLDVGGAAGDLAALIRSRGCRTTVIEADPADALRAAEVADRVVVGDVETLDFQRELAGARFDVVVFADVLEHLREPTAALGRVTSFLAPGGCVLASIPNVAHGALRLSLLAGRWEYTPTGLLDRTHLRFFTRQAVERLFEANGLRIAELRRIEVDPFSTEIPLDRAAYPAGIVEWLAQDPDARTYQFIVRGVVGQEVASAQERSAAARHGAMPASPTPSAADLEGARRRALEQLEFEVAARELALRREIWELWRKAEALKQRVVAADVAADVTAAELRVIKASGSYRLAGILSRILRAIRPRAAAVRRPAEGNRGD